MNDINHKKHIYLSIILGFIFSTSLVAQSDSLSLEILLKKAIENNKKLKSGALELEKTEELRKSIYHNYIPTVSLNGMYAYTGGKLNANTEALDVPYGPISLPPLIPSLPPITIPGGNITLPAVNESLDFNSNLWMGGLTAKWTLFTGLKAPNLAKATEHKLQAQTYMLELEENELIIEVSQYYDKIALLEQSKKVLDAQEQRLIKEEKAARTAKGAGLITHHEYQKIEIAQLKLQSKKIEYEGSKELLMLKLRQLSGCSYSELHMIKTELKPRIIDEGLGSYLDRPELKSLQEVSLANDRRLKAENSAYLPKVQAFAAHQYAGLTNGNIDQFKFNEASIYPLNMVGVGMKWEIFDGLHASGQKQKIKIEQAQLELKKQEATELLELNQQNTLSKYRTLNAQVLLKEKEMSMAEKGLEISNKEYQNGLIKISELLEAVTYYTTTRLEYYGILCDQRSMSLEYLNATSRLTIENLSASTTK